MTTLLLRLVPTLALCSLWVAQAQAGGSEPVASHAQHPALVYTSAFTDYKPWRELKTGDWRAVNETVREAGLKAGSHATGHGAPTPLSTDAVTAQASMPAAPLQGDHTMHGAKK